MSSLSVRASDEVKAKPYYFERVPEAWQDSWDTDNPDGFILAALAENGNMSTKIQNKLNTLNVDIPEQALKYTEMIGRQELRRLVAGLFQRTFMHGITVTPENLLMSTGATSVLSTLTYLLADKGSSFLIPAPYYPMFDSDIRARNGVIPWPIYLKGQDSDTSTLDTAKRAAERAGSPPRALLITNPDNPTGFIYNEQRLRAMLKWCIKHKVHMIVDEIYALSVFQSQTALAPFRSVMNLANDMSDSLSPSEQEVMWDHVHVVYSLSKDFCISGLRAGVLYTYNADLIERYSSVSILCTMCHLSQWMLIQLLQDTSFVDTFIMDNSTELEHQCGIVTNSLDRLGVPYVAPQGAFFVYMDLSKKLGIEDFGRERDIWGAIFDRAKVLLVPGECCHDQTPGKYRICFCAHPTEATYDMMARLEHFIIQYKVKEERQNWNTQGFMLAAGFGMR